MNAAVIGGGPAGLRAAEVLSRAGVRVTLFERMPTAGRKFMMAGRGGLNLTHSEDFARFLSRYGAAELALRPALEAFSPQALRAWCETLGQTTFVGSSGRVFPTALKASPLLRAWLARLTEQGVRFRLRRQWLGWDDDGGLVFLAPNGVRESETADATILALGGASWPKLGTDGAWTDALGARGIKINRLRPANCGFTVAWSDLFRHRFAGHPLKNIALSFAGQSRRGEALVTAYGLEGGGVYSLSAALRDAIEADDQAVLSVDLLPDRSTSDIATRLAMPRKTQSSASFLRKALCLTPVAINLLREVAGPALPVEPERLASLVKALPLTLTAIQPLGRSISTAGGVCFDELTDGFMLKTLPGVFVAGEMLDWEAPTGGYLLQACFATGMAAAKGVLAWLGAQKRTD